MRIKFLLIAIIFCFQNTGFAGNHYAYSPLAREAYDKAISLRLKEARQAIAKLKKQEPGNLVAYHIEDYIDFFTIYIGEDAATLSRLKGNKDRRLSILDDGPANSPWHLFIQADIRLHWALLRFRFGEYISGFSEVNKAAKLLEKNRKLYPHFMPNQKDLGILHAAVGTVPDSYKWGLQLLSSLSGTIEQGRKELETVLTYAERNDFVFREEARGLYALLLLHLDNKGDEAWNAVNSDDWQPEANPLHCFVAAHVAMRTGRTDKAVALLEKRPKGSQFLVFPFLDYMLGLSKLRRLDKDAGTHFQQFLGKFRGRHYIKEAYQKMAWSELINNKPEGYRKYIRYCIQRGFDEAGGDRSALREAQSGQAPDITLLKARLLFDGAYYQQALSILQAKPLDAYKDKKYRLEYTYRLGRIFHGLHRYDEALRYYAQTVNEGSQERYFFACNAALQMGLVYEAKGDKKMARNSYNRCLGMDPDEYKTSLHQQAKAGLTRVK